MILTLLIFLLILSVLVLIHEAGHYFVAKFFGIKVEEFGYGFPPRAWSKKIGETVYSINWLPIGGFVKLFGEDEAGAGRVDLKGKAASTKEKGDEKRAFYARPVWQRASVVVAGVVMNVLLAAAIYYLFLGLSGFKAELPLYNDHKFQFGNQANKLDVIITFVDKGSPAEKAGIKQLSKVLTINNQSILTSEEFKKVIDANKGQVVTMLLRDMQTMEDYTVTVTPRVNARKDQGALGVGFGVPTAVISYDTPAQKLTSGFTHQYNLMSYNLDVIKDLIAISISEKKPEIAGEAVSGPVGIFSYVGNIVKLPTNEAFMKLLDLAGMLSVSLAFFNILPIPALDGGRLFFILIEGVTRRKVNQQVEGLIHTVGMAILLTLILLITFKDIFQLLK